MTKPVTTGQSVVFWIGLLSATAGAGLLFNWALALIVFGVFIMVAITASRQ